MPTGSPMMLETPQNMQKVWASAIGAHHKPSSEPWGKWGVRKTKGKALALGTLRQEIWDSAHQVVMMYSQNLHIQTSRMSMFAHSADCATVLPWQGLEQTIIGSIPWYELLCITASFSGVEMLMSLWLCFSLGFYCKFCVLCIPCLCRKYMLKKYPTTY